MRHGSLKQTLPNVKAIHTIVTNNIHYPSSIIHHPSSNMNHLLSLLFLALTVSQYCMVPTYAQFGVGNKEKKAPKNAVPQDVLNQYKKEQETQQQNGQQFVISEQDAADMEALIQAAAADPETIQIIQQLKADMGPELLELSQLPQEEILGGMKQTLDDIRSLDYLFQDQEKAVEEMNNAGMIEPKHLEAYKTNPALLEEDTRKSLYFQFVGLSVMGGFLEVIEE